MHFFFVEHFSIYLATLKGYIKAVEVLLDDSNLDINMGRAKDGGTAFSMASEKSHFRILKLLVEHISLGTEPGPNVNRSDNHS